MRSFRFSILAGCALLLAAAPAFGESIPPKKTKATAVGAKETKDFLALAAKIDEYLAQGWKAAGAYPAKPADDAEFIRRVYLDVAGRIPSVSEVRAFLNDKAPDKRLRLVDKLLESPAYVNHFSNIWKGLLIPENDTDFELFYFMPSFDSWLRKQFAENVTYDEMVRDLLTASPSYDRRRGFDFQEIMSQTNPNAFYMAKKVKPENLGAATARLFLGIKLECAQCHDHPFARWTRSQFWEYAAFFAGMQKQGDFFFAPVQEFPDRRELAISGSSMVVQASFLDGKEPQWKYKTSSRVTLADWMTSADNPFFSRAAANRLWSLFFGIGIVEPVDDLSDQNKPSHPELLDELARQFAAHKFDIKFMIRAITASKAYQTSSVASHPTQDQPRLFARMAVKGLSPDQLFDSIAQATGYKQGARTTYPFFFGVENPRQEFMTKFADQEKKTEAQTSILQALSLMNGKFVSDATHLSKSGTLAAVIESPFMDDGQRIEALYLATLSRKPTAKEAERMLKYLEGKKNAKAAFSDVFWALLNSSEFVLNH